MATDDKTLFEVVMGVQVSDAPNVRQAVPFFNVKDIEAFLRFYVDGLGFTITRQWEPDGRIRWCWLELGQVAVMLQEYWKDGRPGGWALRTRPSSGVGYVGPRRTTAARSTYAYKHCTLSKPV